MKVFPSVIIIFLSCCCLFLCVFKEKEVAKCEPSHVATQHTALFSMSADEDSAIDIAESGMCRFSLSR